MCMFTHTYTCVYIQIIYMQFLDISQVFQQKFKLEKNLKKMTNIPEKKTFCKGTKVARDLYYGYSFL